MQNLMKKRKELPVVNLQQTIFYNISILCLWHRIIRKSNQGGVFDKFPSQISFSDIDNKYKIAILKKNYLRQLQFYMATYCFYEKVPRMMRTAAVSHPLNIKQLICIW